MASKKIHKMVRQLSKKAELVLCTKKRADFSEHTSYFWKNVDCPKCKALKK